MGYYIKITGRGYLKNLTAQQNTSNLGWAGKFSKQLTLSYCADSENEASTYQTQLLAELVTLRNKTKVEYEAALKIITFPEMFNTSKDIVDFLKKQGIKVKTTSYCWEGLERLVKDAKTTVVLTSIKEFKDSYWGFRRYEELYKNLEVTCKLIKKGKIVELENDVVKVSPGKKKNFSIKVSPTKQTFSYSWKMYCVCCGANIPGAAYLVVAGIPICPYCLSKFAEDAEKSIKKLGPGIAKNYKTAVFVNAL